MAITSEIVNVDWGSPDPGYPDNTKKVTVKCCLKGGNVADEAYKTTFDVSFKFCDPDDPRKVIIDCSKYVKPIRCVITGPNVKVPDFVIHVSKDPLPAGCKLPCCVLPPNCKNFVVVIEAINIGYGTIPVVKCSSPPCYCRY